MSVQPRESAEKPGTRTTDQHQKPKSDIEISQAAKMRPIVEVAAEKLDIPPEFVLPYGHYKAKISLDYIASLAEPDGGGGLAFAGGRGRDGGDEDRLAVGAIGERSDVVERDLRLVVAVRQDEFRRNVELLRRHLDDRPHFGGLRDFDVGFWLLVLIGCARAWFLGTFTRLN